MLENMAKHAEVLHAISTSPWVRFNPHASLDGLAPLSMGIDSAAHHYKKSRNSCYVYLL
jgi:hypothetical protein